MRSRAPRLIWRIWRRLARGARLLLCLWPVFLTSSAALAQSGAVITAAEYADPTTRYGHGVLGDAVEWGNLHVTVTRNYGKKGGLFQGHTSLTYHFKMPDELVFEDLEPRLWDVTGDGAPEVVVVQSHRDLGARLLVIGLGADGKPGYLGSTPHIGRTNRWLAPVGAADLDGDGRIEIAYIDRPHLAKLLRIWRFDGDDLRHVSDIPGLTNHKIGWDLIPGGIRDCGDGPEIITADARWQQIVATRFAGGKAVKRAVAPYKSSQSFAGAMACRQ
jgi:hypothetical protein